MFDLPYGHPCPGVLWCLSELLTLAPAVGLLGCAVWSCAFGGEE